MRNGRLVALAFACAVACSASEPRDTADAQRLRGDEAYRRHCYPCHDVDGAIGVELSARVLRYYGTAGALLSYTRLAMPYTAPGSLTEHEYVDIVAYLLHSRYVGVDAVLTAQAADSLSIPPTPQ